MTNEQFLQELIAKLSEPIPHQWRVQSFSKNKPSATCVGYISSRDAIDLLNKHAIYGWHREHYAVKDNLFCRVGVVMPDGSILWRSDCGTESQADAEKGESSDSFKRACVNFGIGRFLYDLGMEYVNANEKKTQSNWPYCVDERGEKIWDLTKYITDRKSGVKPTAPKAPTKPQPAPKAPAKTEEPKGAIAPNQSFDKKKGLNEDQKKALAAFGKLDASAVLKHLITVQKFSYATVEDFVAGESIEKVREVYAILSKK